MPDPNDSSATSPLAGLIVVDLTRVLAGPVCGRILADLGANVIKIEPPDGDLSREIAPKRDRGNSGLYTLANAGKRNVSIDLTRPGGRELVLALYARAEVVLENFRPGVADRLGVWARDSGTRSYPLLGVGVRASSEHVLLMFSSSMAIRTARRARCQSD